MHGSVFLQLLPLQGHGGTLVERRTVLRCSQEQKCQESQGPRTGAWLWRCAPDAARPGEGLGLQPQRLDRSQAKHAGEFSTMKH